MTVNKNVLHDPYEPFVYVFDDEGLFTKPFARQLRKQGIRVHSATTKKRAYQLLNDNEYDGFCVDIKTPWSRYFGFDLINIILEKNLYAPIHVISAHREYKKRSEEFGASFIEKPIDDIAEYANTLKQELLINSASKERHFKHGEDYDSSLTDFILETVQTLDKSPDIKFILLDIFGKEIPDIKNKVFELQNLAKVSNKYLRGTKKMLRLGKKLLEMDG